MDLVGLGDKADERAGRLSGGQQRRLDMAIALIGDAELLVPRRANDRLRPFGPAPDLGLYSAVRGRRRPPEWQRPRRYFVTRCILLITMRSDAMSMRATERSTAESIRGRVLRSRDRFWRVEDFDGSTNAVNAALHRLVEAGELERVRRGVYWRGHKSRFGRSGAQEGQALRRLIGGREAIGAAEWHATNLLGLSTQVSPIEVFALTRRPPTGFSRLRLIDRSQRIGRRDQRLNDLEVTFLEALEGWDTYVELPGDRATKRFLDLLGEVRIDKLVAASKTESASVRERLRALLLRRGDLDAAMKISRARHRATRERALAVSPELAEA